MAVTNCPAEAFFDVGWNWFYMCWRVTFKLAQPSLTEQTWENLNLETRLSQVALVCWARPLARKITEKNIL